MLEQFSGELLDTSTFVSRAYAAVESLSERDVRIRQRGGSKELLEEVMPIAAFLKSFEVPGRRLRAKCFFDNGNRDAVLQVEGHEAEKGILEPSYFIEVTSAVSSLDYLRREALHRNGFVFGGDRIRRVGSRQRGDDEIVSEAVAENGEQAVHACAMWIIERLKEKAVKSYPQPCILLLGAQPDRPLDLDEWSEVCRKVASARVVTEFAAVAAIDPWRNLVVWLSPKPSTAHVLTEIEDMR